MRTDLIQIYDNLFEYCEKEGFAGWDPFDGLNSRVFRAAGLSGSAAARMAWLQLVKRSPVNLRPIARVAKGVNAKGLALFALAELSRFRLAGSELHRDKALKLLEMLRGIAIEGETADGKPTKAFGYNFDWQSRAFFAPKGTPTIVPTAFAAKAFVENYELFGEKADLEAAEEICSFILNGLETPHRTHDEICFSYKPNDQSVIFNASLLAGETLARVGAVTGNRDHLETAAKTAVYVIRNQGEDGSWAYGPKLRHAWIDNFHTAFVLGSLKAIGERVQDLETEPAIRKGFAYWHDNFFLPDGAPKYFSTAAYPFDIHSAAAAIAALAEFHESDSRALPLAEKVAAWAITNLRDGRGYFYYQKRRFSTVKTPFIRWGQAWMAYALARLIETRA